MTEYLDANLEDFKGLGWKKAAQKAYNLRVEAHKNRKLLRVWVPNEIEKLSDITYSSHIGLLADVVIRKTDKPEIEYLKRRQ